MSAHLPYVEEPPAELTSVYEEMRQATGRVLNITKLMAHHPPTVAPFRSWYKTLREGTLDLTLRQLAYVKVSQLSRCEY